MNENAGLKEGQRSGYLVLFAIGAMITFILVMISAF